MRHPGQRHPRPPGVPELHFVPTRRQHMEDLRIGSPRVADWSRSLYSPQSAEAQRVNMFTQSHRGMAPYSPRSHHEVLAYMESELDDALETVDQLG